MATALSDDRNPAPAAPAEATPTDFSPIELEMALDLVDPAQDGFAACVQAAANVIGGELLFEMPCRETLPDAERIAAIGIGDGDVAFVVLAADGETVRVVDAATVGERFHGFAHAFIGVLSRIRADMPIRSALDYIGTA